MHRSLRLADPQGQASGLPVPDRMALVADWRTPQDHCLELYADLGAGDGVLLAVPHCGPAEPVASIFCSGGVVRAIVWRGFAAAETPAWRQVQRAQTAALIADRHAGGAS